MDQLAGIYEAEKSLTRIRRRRFYDLQNPVDMAILDAYTICTSVNETVFSFNKHFREYVAKRLLFLLI